MASLTPSGRRCSGEGCVGHRRTVSRPTAGVSTLESMKLGVHYANFSHPDWSTHARRAAHRDGAGRRPGRRLAAHRHGPLVPDGEPRRTRRADARGLHHPGLPGGGHRAGPAQPARHRGDLPPPGPARQDRSPRSTGCPAAGRCSASAPPGTTASTRASACRSRRRAERFERLEEALQVCLQMWGDDDGAYDGTPLPARRDRQRAAAGPAAAPADPDRRERGAEDAAAGRAVRRRVQPVRRGPGRRRAQARRAARPLRRRGHRLRRHREDDDHARATRSADADALPRRHGGVRRARDRHGHAGAGRRRPGRLDHRRGARRCCRDLRRSELPPRLAGSPWWWPSWRRPARRPTGENAQPKRSPAASPSAPVAPEPSSPTAHPSPTPPVRRQRRAPPRRPDRPSRVSTSWIWRCAPTAGWTDDAAGTRIQNTGIAASPHGPRGGAGPGGIGNYQVTGHRTSSTRVFEFLPDLRRGDRVVVRAGGTALRLRGRARPGSRRSAAARRCASSAPPCPGDPARPRPAR